MTETSTFSSIAGALDNKFPGKFRDDELIDYAARLRWATVDEVLRAASEHNCNSRFRPTVFDLKVLIDKERGTDARPRPEIPLKSHAEVLAIAGKMPPAAAVVEYWRKVWIRYSSDAVQREANLPADGSGRDLFERQFAGMGNKVRTGAYAALIALGGKPQQCQSIADQITGASAEKFARTFAWLCENELPKMVASGTSRPVRREIFGTNIFREVAPLLNPNAVHDQRMALEASARNEA